MIARGRRQGCSQLGRGAMPTPIIKRNRTDIKKILPQLVTEGNHVIWPLAVVYRAMRERYF